MQEHKLIRTLAKLPLPLIYAAMLSLLASCSDGGGNAGASTATTTTTTGNAATVQLSVSLPQILSTPTSTSIMSAIVLDGTGQAIAGKTVTFSVGNDPTAYFTSVTTTDTNGVATATLNIGANMTNRTISVSATADSAVGTNSVDVVGTNITVSGSASLVSGASTALTISLKSSAGAAVSGVTLAVSSQTGNSLSFSPTNRVTNSSGQITATVTITQPGNDVLTITGGGATQTFAITVTTESFTFTAPVVVPPATTPEIMVNTPTPVTVLWLNPAPVSGGTVYFFTSRGTITASAVTNGSGVATASITAASTGQTTITASDLAGLEANLDVVFITDTADTITAQASPGTIGINVSPSTINQSVISVVVRDAALNLVKNALVSFSLASDPSGGHLSSTTALTDISGTASVNYVAGGSSSGVNMVDITATVVAVNGAPIAPTIPTSTTLTVADQAYYVRLETDNTVGISGPNYTKNYYALVTDSAGHARTNIQVGFTIRPVTPPAPSFAKGEYIVAGTVWQQSVSVTCPSEDLNSNGIRDLTPADEDANGDSKLDPYGVASVNATATTNSSGFATATITYVKNYATWATLVLEARTMVTGNDPPALVTVTLPGAATDYGNISIAPPGETSPWGLSASCADTL